MVWEGDKTDPSVCSWMRHLLLVFQKGLVSSLSNLLMMGAMEMGPSTEGRASAATPAETQRLRMRRGGGGPPGPGAARGGAPPGGARGGGGGGGGEGGDEGGGDVPRDLDAAVADALDDGAVAVEGSELEHRGDDAVGGHVLLGVLAGGLVGAEGADGDGGVEGGAAGRRGLLGERGVVDGGGGEDADGLFVVEAHDAGEVADAEGAER